MHLETVVFCVANVTFNKFFIDRIIGRIASFTEKPLSCLTWRCTVVVVLNIFCKTEPRFKSFSLQLNSVYQSEYAQNVTANINELRNSSPRN